MAFDTASVSGHSGGTGRQIGEITAATASGGSGGGSSLFSFLGGGSGGFLDEAMGWFNDNPDSVSVIGKGISGFIGGEQTKQISQAKRDSYLHAASIKEATAALIREAQQDEVEISQSERNAKRRRDMLTINKMAPQMAKNGVLLGGGSARDVMLASMINSISDQGDMKVNEKRRIFGLEVEEFNVLSQADIYRTAANEINPGADALITSLGATTTSIFDIMSRQNRRVSSA